VSDREALIAKIEKLSPAGLALLAEYLEFLSWREQVQSQADETQMWSYSFIETFGEATVAASGNPAGMDVIMAPATVGDDTRPALWAHPPVSGRTTIEYFVPVPRQVHDLKLKTAIGIRDGAKIAKNNLVAFNIKVNGLRVWGAQTNHQVWQLVEIPIRVTTGDIVRFTFTTEALGSHEWTWAVWGNPELVGSTVAA
jgi:hypothetical protein